MRFDCSFMVRQEDPKSRLREDDALSFFFSSRRRHTRCSRDWSSDVCSSDLSMAGLELARLAIERRKIDPVALHQLLDAALRSEERRVGKECRSRWSWSY